MKNSINETIYITLFCVVIFSAWSFIPQNPSFFKRVDFLGDIRHDGGKDKNESKVAGEEKPGVIDLKADSTPANPVNHQLIHFLTALRELKSGSGENVRVAYFGDSMIEGDLITNDLRKKIQEIFGGNGVGFVPMISATAKFRSSIVHTFNDNWTAYNFVKSKSYREKQFGPSGYVFIPKKNAQVTFKASKEYRPFEKIRLLYGKTEAASLTVKTDGAIRDIEISGNDILNEILLHDGPGIKEVQINVKDSKDACFYGCSFETSSGVYIDNFSFRGNSGVPLSAITSEMYTAHANSLNYKLVILHFGLNVVSHQQSDYSWYKRSFQKTIQHIKTNFPEASILLLSVTDKGYRENNEWNTESNIPPFVSLQEKLALDNDVAFLNLYEAMGGYNSMKSWVETNPPLANKDYTHPNFRGAEKIAGILFDFVESKYDQFIANEGNKTTASSKSAKSLNAAN